MDAASVQPHALRSQALSIGLPRRAFMLCAGVAALALILAGVALLRSPPPVNLASADSRSVADMHTAWARGDLIVLVRHVERCDHSAAECLEGSDGITARGRDVARELGGSFRQMGLARADIFSSPLKRAMQTAAFMFDRAEAGQPWLFNCRENIVRDALKHKRVGRNLVLVTHSECIAKFEEDMHLAPVTPEYGSALFISVDSAHSVPRALGYVDAQGWASIF